MQGSPSYEYVLLRNLGDIVGTANILFSPGSASPRTSIHGNELGSYAKAGEVLVAVHKVIIFVEFESRRYPYFFDGIESPPSTLGDLNDADVSFKAVVAWDLKKTTPNPKPSIGVFTCWSDVPRRVSKSVVSPFRHLLSRSKPRVRFADESADPVGTVRILDLSSDDDSDDSDNSDSDNSDNSDSNNSDNSDSDDSGDSNRDRLGEPEFYRDESVDQFAEEEKEKEALAGHLDESVDQFAEEDFVENNADRFGQQGIHRDESVDQFAEEEQDAAMDAPVSNRDESFDQFAEGLEEQQPESSIVKEGTSMSRQVWEEGQSSSKCTSNSAPGALVQFGVPRLDTVRQAMMLSSSNQFDASLNGSRSNGGASVGQKRRRECEERQDLPTNIKLRTDAFGGEDTSSIDRTHIQSPFDVLSSQLPAALTIKKRRYNFKTRRPAAPKKMGKFYQKCLQLRAEAIRRNPFLVARDCCGMFCFDNVNPDYARAQFLDIMLMKRPERKRALTGMFDRGPRKFRFDGNIVCSRFLNNGFLFSNTLQSIVKSTALSRSSPSIFCCPRETLRETKKERVTLFLKRLAETSGDNIPNKPHINLPMMNKKQVYDKLLEQLRAKKCVDVPTESYFYRVWDEMCPHIKTHRYHGFTVCDECESHRSLMHKNSNNEQAQAIIRSNMRFHFDKVADERRGYAERIDLAVKYPAKYCSIIVDGADQSSYGLPHFIFKRKQERGHKLKVKVVGLLEHGTEKRLSLFTMTEEYQTGANHIIEAVHRALNEKKQREGRLPETLLVQADNCTRENKNKYFMAYFEMLVATGVFLEVQVSFLPIGHTHSDIDQCFSSVATRLRSMNTVTMEDLLRELGTCYKRRAHPSQMLSVVNFSGLCKNEGCLKNVSNFSIFRFFRFSRSNVLPRNAGGSASSADGEPRWFRTTCDVKHQERDEWCPMDNGPQRLGFLKFVPDLRKSPPTETRPPTNVQQINECLRSNESYIGSLENIQKLERLRDRVYTQRVEPFHWNVEEMFENNGDYLHGDVTPRTDNLEQVEEELTDRLPYTVNFFVAVITEDDEPDPFWIARILSVEKHDDPDGEVKLNVSWYQAKEGSTSPYTARYEISTFVDEEGKKQFDQKLDARTVICEFESLTRSGGLHVRTQKAIRQSLNQS